MKYDNSNVRRQNRLLNESDAENLLDTGEYGILSMLSKTDGVYGIPISYVWDKEHSLYFHCAPEGKKLVLLEEDNRASFCIVGKTEVIPGKFTTLYESLVLKGAIVMNLSKEEGMYALELLVDKYSLDYKDTGRQYAEKSFSHMRILRMDIIEYSGKSKQIR